MRILAFGTYDRRKHPRVGIVLDGLAQRGESVTELNAPLGFSTAERVAMLGKPWSSYRLLLRLIRCWSVLTYRRLALLGRGPDVVVVGYLGHFDVMLARLLFPRRPILLDLLIFAADTAVDRGMRRGLKTKMLASLDRLAIRCATAVMIDTDEHRALMPRSQAHKAVVVPVGADDDWFDLGGTALSTERSAGDPLRVVFFGLFTPLQGAPVIGDAMASIDPATQISLVMVGDGQDLAETRRRMGVHPDVHWHDWMEPADLQRLVHDSDVCLGIFGDTDKAMRVTPNKVYQGAAAGCAVLTSDTGPQRRSLGDAAVFVPAGDPARLAEALSSLAADPAEVHRLRTAARQRAEQYFRPRAIAASLCELLVEIGTPRKRA